MSSDELLVVVDRDDNILDYLPRKQVHQQKLLHRTISILVYNSKGELILQKRSAKMDTYPGLYSNASGGHVTKGFNYDETATKEIFEEIGVSPKLEVVKKMIIDDPNHYTMTTVYRTVSDGPFKEDREEIDELRAFSKEELIQSIDILARPAQIVFRELGLL